MFQPEAIKACSLLISPSRLMHFRKLYENKINLNFYFHTSLWCLQRFYDDDIYHYPYNDVLNLEKLSDFKVHAL